MSITYRRPGEHGGRVSNLMVHAPIIGLHSIELDGSTLDRLDAIFPGPGGETTVPSAW